MSVTTEAQDVLDRTKSISDELATVRERVLDLSSRADRLVRVNPLPEAFTGLVRDYRYTTRDFNGNFSTPLHKLFLDCGSGLWLYSQNTSEQFERVVIGMEMPEVASMRGLLLDKVVRVVRNTATNQLTIADIVADKAFKLRDSRGQVLYEGAQVTHPQYPGPLTREDVQNNVVYVLSAEAERAIRPAETVRSD